ncbi:MAG: SDR family NAD(P)-dependent oxidoreductase [Candidatus Bathyarchaeia archaeon]
MSKVLVTGGAGFIGSHLVPRLLAKQYSVVVLDNLSSGKLDNLKESQNNPSFEFIYGDIRDKQMLVNALRGVDAVVHLAALIDVAASVVDPLGTNEVNVAGTVNLLQTAVKSKVKRFVFASSTAVYGDAQVLPVKENTVLKPISPYAASKAACEAYCSGFAGCYGLDAVALRFFNVFGLGNENNPYSGVITKFLRKALNGEVLTVDGNGEQTRDFIYVSDVADALICALTGKDLRGNAFNVCTGAPTSINQLVEAVKSVTGKNLQVTHGPARQGDIRYSYGDAAKSAEKLKFTSKVSLSTGLEMLLKSFEKQTSH